MALGIMAAAGAIAGAMGVLNSMLYTYPPYAVGRARQTFLTNPNMLPPIADLMSMRFKGEIGGGEYTTYAKEIGFDNTISEPMYEAAKRLLDARDYIAIWRRGHIQESDLDTKLRQLRLPEEDLENLKKASEYFPAPPDLVRFAVREVYTTATRERFGMDEDRPEEYMQEAAKAGLPDEQAKNFWAAHWELPSPLQGFEMFQRDVIKGPDLEMLLKALDVMPYWRDKLTQIAYNPLTRVDIRRMHKLGKLDDKGVFDAYRHVGFSPENAELMLEFTKAYNADTQTGITRANVVKAYKLDLIDLDDFKRFLIDFGYSKDVVDFWVDMTEYEKTMEKIDARKAELFEQYRVGSITMDTVREQLGYEDLPSSYVESIITTELAQPSKKLKMPSRTDLESWLKKQIIDEGYYTYQMRELGFKAGDIQNYLTEIAWEIDTSKPKYLPITTYKRWLTKEIISKEVFSNVATAMDIRAADISILIMEAEEARLEGAG